VLMVSGAAVARAHPPPRVTGDDRMCTALFNSAGRLTSRAYLTFVMYGAMQLPAFTLDAGCWMPSRLTLALGTALAVHGLLCTRADVSLGDGATLALPWLGAAVALAIGEALGCVSSPMLPGDVEMLAESVRPALIPPPLSSDALSPASWSTVRACNNFCYVSTPRKSLCQASDRA
jgi:hypothetical protein